MKRLIQLINKFCEDFSDGMKIGKRLAKEQKQLFGIYVIDLKKPMERWEFKFYYLKCCQKFTRDRENEQHSTIWDWREEKMLKLEEYIAEAEKDYLSPRNYCSASISSAFMMMPGAGNVHMRF